MSRPGNKNLLIIIAVLLVTNIGVLGYFLWYEKPQQHPPAQRDNRGGGIGDLLQHNVGFSEDQLAQYRQMKDTQRSKIRPMYDEMRKAKDSLFRLLKEDEVQDSVAQKVADQIAVRQKMLDLQTFNYFRKVRTLCTADQRPKYDSLIQGMFIKTNHPPRKPDSDSTKNDKRD